MADPLHDVVVVGGGVAGLTATRALLGRGLRVLLLEASSRWGGVVRTEREGAFVLDGGPDSLLAQKPEGVGLCRELGLGDRLVPTNTERRVVYVWHRGRLHAMPDGMVLGIPTRLWPMATSGLFSWRAKMRMAREPFVARGSGADESVGAFIERRLGREAVERLGEPLLGGIHAGDPYRLSLRATFPRLLDLEQKHGSLVLGMRAAARQAGGTAFVSLAGGMGELVDALVASIADEARRLETPVDRVERRGDTFVVGAGPESWRARAVLLAAPAHRCSSLLGAVAPDAAAGLTAIRFASTATVLMGFRRHDVAHPLDGYGFVVPRTEGRRLLAGTFASTKLPGRAPDGHVLLRAFLGGVHAPDLLSCDDATIVQYAFDEMTAVLGLRGAPLFARVFRWANGTPQMELGHAERVAAVERSLAAAPGVFVTSGGFRGAGLPDVIADAHRTADAAAASLRG